MERLFAGVSVEERDAGVAELFPRVLGVSEPLEDKDMLIPSICAINVTP